MPDWTWTIVIAVLVVALIYGAYLLGRASAMAEARGSTPVPAEPIESEAQAPRAAPTRTPSAAPPPVLAGGERAATGTSAQAPPQRRAAPPPAAAAGSAQTTHAGAAPANAPRRTAAPPPAQAAWSNPKPGANKDKG